jgi:hypothetical protein
VALVNLVDEFRQPLVDFGVLHLRGALLGPFEQVAIEVEVDSLFH